MRGQEKLLLVIHALMRGQEKPLWIIHALMRGQEKPLWIIHTNALELEIDERLHAGAPELDHDEDQHRQRQHACTTKGERVTASRTVMSQRLGRKWVT